MNSKWRCFWVACSTVLRVARPRCRLLVGLAHFEGSCRLTIGRYTFVLLFRGFRSR